jgi:molybdenum cofactor biosynthesis enzyme MoaA
LAAYIGLQLWLLYSKIRSIKRLKQRSSLRFDVHLVDHCNLHCKGCEHFSPLATKKFLDIETYKRDCSRLSELAVNCNENNRGVTDISLLGGEPLLNPQTNDFIVITRKYFPIAEIRIVTNGILLPKQTELFWKCCYENNIEICISVYPIMIEYSAINILAKKYKVKIT